MAVPDEYRDRVMELLANIGDIKARAMFGGYGIFESGDMFALMSGKALFFKVDESNHAAYEQAGSQRYGPMPYFRVPDSVLEDTTVIHGWAQAAISVGHATKSKKSKR